MKKRISLLLALVLVALALAGCAGTPVVYYADCNCPEGTHAADTTAPQTTPAPAEGALKTGLAFINDVSGSKDAEVAKFDVTVAAVLVDENGVIRACTFDSIGTDISFDASGVISSNVNAEIKTKTELGYDYNMKKFAGSNYEWFEQAKALSDYAVGKTVAELKNGAVSENGKAPKGTDLAATATITIAGYVDAIEKAVNNAKSLGAQAGDELRFAVTANTASSVNATAEKNGTAQMDIDAVALTVNGGKITSCVIDSAQVKVNFKADGSIASTDTATKNEKGAAYNMVAYGKAIAEWDVQTASFCSYVTGKTLDEVKGIAVKEGTKPSEADLSSSVTIAIGGFQGLIEKAIGAEAASSEGALMTGLAFINDVSGSKDAEVAKFDVTVAAVLVDENGVIRACTFDSIGTDISFDASGVISSNVNAEIKTKTELGYDYNMKKFAGSNYEWFEQAKALSDYAVGKTVAELKNGAVSENGKAPKGTDLAATATITIAGYVDAIEKAVNNAKSLGAQAGDELRFAVTANTASSLNATAEKNGAAQMDIDAVALTVNGGKITSCVIDSAQVKVNFKADGSIASTDTATKNEKGAAYNMVAYGKAIAEWDVQTASFCSYVTGKTLDEVKGIAVKEGSKPAEADLSSSVTIAIGGFQGLIEKAFN